MADDWNGGINRRALFADETSDYRMPEEPDEGERAVLRFRTAKGNADHVFYIEEDRGIEIDLTRKESDGLFDYYECEIAVGREPQHYYFQIVKDQDICYFNRLGATMDVKRCFAFCMTPGFHTPEWAKGAVMYQIFVDRFCNGDPSNDVDDREYIYVGRPIQKVKDWNENPSTLDVGRFYGGDLQGVWSKLDYLQYLGVEVIYFNPLFVSPSNHKYDTQDYDHIDPHYGMIVKDGGEPVRPAARGNKRASRYRMRSAGRKNLEASNELFARFME
ncbi:MAG: alpha amylase N-terminal ig-like domain-containing protein, partial [Clostridium sp.]|nr:alpha amylase N-terminal ig-like domain-containing protein [Clostridium sp.]